MKKTLVFAAVLATVGLSYDNHELSIPTATAAPAKAPLRIAFSDWPGWTAFEI